MEVSVYTGHTKSGAKSAGKLQCIGHKSWSRNGEICRHCSSPWHAQDPDPVLRNACVCLDKSTCAMQSLFARRLPQPTTGNLPACSPTYIRSCCSTVHRAHIHPLTSPPQPAAAQVSVPSGGQGCKLTAVCWRFHAPPHLPASHAQATPQQQ